MAPKPIETARSVTTFSPCHIRTSPFYSHVATASSPASIVTTAGQIGLKPDGTIPSETHEQIKQAFTNLRRCLEAAGARIEDVLKLTYYIVGFDHTNPQHRSYLLDFIGEHRPVSTLVPVPKLAIPGIVFEIEATAAIPQHPLEKVDVVVVGAGLSGLQTAVDLQDAGLKVKVLEARDRVGGKTWSRLVDGSVCDVGAAWLNDTNQSRMFALAQKFRLDLLEQNVTGRIIVDAGVGNHKAHPYGQLVSDSDDEARINDVVRVRNIFEATCQKIDVGNPVSSGLSIRADLDRITFETWIRSLGCTEDAVNALTIGVRAMLGVEPAEVSALYFLDYCKSGGGYLQMRNDTRHGGQFMRVAQGTQSFSTGLAAQLDAGSLLFYSPVRKIHQGNGVVTIVSARGTFEASRVVVSVPTPLYREIDFEPPLPKEKLELAQTTKLGDYCKMIAIYTRPWWRDSDLCGLAQSCHGPFAVTRDTSIENENHYSLTCFVTGQPAREWAKLSTAARREAVVDQIHRLFGPFAEVEEPKEVVEQIWRNEQWSQGCPCPVMGPGGLTAFDHVLRAPTGRIHYVGTETAFEWKGYMEGAVRSGERGAREVLLAMNKARL